MPAGQVPSYGGNPYSSSGNNYSQQQNQMSQEQMAKAQQMQNLQRQWPTIFPKPIVGLDRDGTIVEDIGEYITNHSQIKYISGSLDAIRMIRLKGHRLMILTNQGGIHKKLQTVEQVDAVHQGMMQDFGNAGIFSIDGLLYSTSSLKDDIYAKPNIGMFNRAKEENKINWKEGWYVGDKISDLKAADKVGSHPILVLTGHGEKTLKELETFANRDLKKKTKIYKNLLEFAQSL
jgi:D-glycero-D-manno-heptose 1,7-bisphosphate phosphatase